MIAEIEKYLNGSTSFDEGAALFLKLSKNKHLARKIVGRPTDYNVRKLHYELEKIHEEERFKQPPQEKHERTQTPDTRLASKNQRIRPEETKEDQPSIDLNPNRNYQPLPNKSLEYLLHDCKEERKKRYRERGFYHAQLHLAATNESRFELAKQIIRTQELIDTINVEYNQLQAGKLPNHYSLKTLTAQEFQRKKNVESYIRRYTIKLEEATSIETRDKYRKLLDKYKTELSSINAIESTHITQS